MLYFVQHLLLKHLITLNIGIVHHLAKILLAPLAAGLSHLKATKKLITINQDNPMYSVFRFADTKPDLFSGCGKILNSGHSCLTDSK